MAAKKRHAGSSRNPLVRSTESIGQAETVSHLEPEREELARGQVDAVLRFIKAIAALAETSKDDAEVQNLHREIGFAYAARSLKKSAALFATRLDLIFQELRDSPELGPIFESHAALAGYAKTKAPGSEVLPDFPSERYEDRPAGEDILDFLRRVWQPKYLYYGFANAEDIKAVDPEAFKAIPWPKVRYKPRQNLEQFLNDNWRSLIELDLATRAFVASYDELLGVAIANRLRGGRRLELEPPTLKLLNSRALTATAVPARHMARIAGTQATRLRRKIA